VVEAIGGGRLSEAFGVGTAAIVSPVGKLAWGGAEHVIGDGGAGELTRRLYDEITGIQLGEIDDRHGWNRVLDTDRGVG